MFIPGFVVEKIELSLYRVVNVNTERERGRALLQRRCRFFTPWRTLGIGVRFARVMTRRGVSKLSDVSGKKMKEKKYRGF